MSTDKQSNEVKPEFLIRYGDSIDDFLARPHAYIVAILDTDRRTWYLGEDARRGSAERRAFCDGLNNLLNPPTGMGKEALALRRTTAGWHLRRLGCTGVRGVDFDEMKVSENLPERLVLSDSRSCDLEDVTLDHHLTAVRNYLNPEGELAEMTDFARTLRVAADLHWLHALGETGVSLEDLQWSTAG